MPEPAYLAAAVLVSVAVTWSLRALPFAVLARMRASKAVRFLLARMPAGVMVVLVLYCLRELPALTTIAALAVTIGLHLWRRNALLSLLAGTIVHVALASTIGAS